MTVYDYFLLGAAPNSLKKIIVHWETFEEGYLAGEGLSADLDGVLQPVRGAVPRYWKGTIQADDMGVWPDDYYSLQDLMVTCVSSPMLYLVTQFGEGPIPILWLGPFVPQWVSPAARQSHVSFTFIEVL
jgi:hypothetical protein